MGRTHHSTLICSFDTLDVVMLVFREGPIVLGGMWHQMEDGGGWLMSWWLPREKGWRKN
jgi:hypothetical protein